MENQQAVETRANFSVENGLDQKKVASKTEKIRCCWCGKSKKTSGNGWTRIDSLRKSLIPLVEEQIHIPRYKCSEENCKKSFTYFIFPNTQYGGKYYFPKVYDKLFTYEEFVEEEKQSREMRESPLYEKILKQAAPRKYRAHIIKKNEHSNPSEREVLMKKGKKYLKLRKKHGDLFLKYDNIVNEIKERIEEMDDQRGKGISENV